jgi:hypothetical protein
MPAPKVTVWPFIGVAPDGDHERAAAARENEQVTLALRSNRWNKAYPPRRESSNATIVRDRVAGAPMVPNSI